MFGISGGEFLVVLVVIILVVPPRRLPDVAKFVGRAVRYIRGVISKIQDEVDELEREIPVSQKDMDDMIETFSTPIKPRIRAKPIRRKSGKKAAA